MDIFAKVAKAEKSAPNDQGAVAVKDILKRKRSEQGTSPVEDSKYSFDAPGSSSPKRSRRGRTLAEPQPTLLLSQSLQTKKLVLHEEALELLQQGRHHVPLVVVAMVGKARRGKSFLLNRCMLGKAKRMFQVSSSSNACTKGVIIHGSPWCLADLGRSLGIPEAEIATWCDVDVVFADTEGIDATDRDGSYDNNMLTFTCVSSSAMIYNAHGPIDEDALSKISMIAEVGRSLVTENSSENASQTVQGLSPVFHWCARDFALICHDADGNEITPDEYLEFQLTLSVGSQGTKDRMRQAFCDFFTRRMCHTLPRPVSDEADLRRVQDMDDEELKPAFMDAMKTFRGRLFASLSPKLIEGHKLSCHDTVHMMRRYVESINAGSVPNIQDSWHQVAVANVERAMEKAFVQFQNQCKNDLACASSPSVFAINAASAYSNALESIEIVAKGIQMDPEKYRAFSNRCCDALNDAWEECQNSYHTISVSTTKVVDSVRPLPTLADCMEHVSDGDDVQNAITQWVSQVSMWFTSIKETIEESVCTPEVKHARLQGIANRWDGSGTSSSNKLWAFLRKLSSLDLKYRAVHDSYPKLMHKFAQQLSTVLTHALDPDTGVLSSTSAGSRIQQKYKDALETLQEEVRNLDKRLSEEETLRKDAERQYEALSHELEDTKQALCKEREEMSTNTSAELRARELGREVEDLKRQQDEQCRMFQDQMDTMESDMRRQVEDALQEVSKLRTQNKRYADDISRLQHDHEVRLTEATTALLSERKASETRERMIEGERHSHREELQNLRNLLNDAQTRFVTKMDKRQRQLLDSSEEHLRWAEKVRTMESITVRAQCEKQTLEKEVHLLKEQVKQGFELREKFEHLKALVGRMQAENEWLKTDRETLREQAKTQTQELMLARQDLRAARFNSVYSLKSAST